MKKLLTFVVLVVAGVSLRTYPARADTIQYFGEQTGNRLICASFDIWSYDGTQRKMDYPVINPPVLGAPFQADLVVGDSVPGATASASASQTSEFGPTSFHASASAAAASSIACYGACGSATGESYFYTEFFLPTDCDVSITGTVAGNASDAPQGILKRNNHRQPIWCTYNCVQ